MRFPKFFNFSIMAGPYRSRYFTNWRYIVFTHLRLIQFNWDFFLLFVDFGFGLIINWWNREGLSTRSAAVSGKSDEIQLRIDPMHVDFDEEVFGLRKQVRQLRNVCFAIYFLKLDAYNIIILHDKEFYVFVVKCVVAVMIMCN